MDKMREEFEEWAKSQGLYVYYIERDDMYSHRPTDTAWWAWQASRKALVVELPVAFPVCDDKDSAEVYFSDDIRKALEAAGVAYK